ncbi:MAG: two component, sigma54 specific, transcriptional regulator, Fis family [Gemmatimonadetes bacterium]|nr:two component, sigma54 specific, transcriptional regulator, Fis family [Gemmatimonadota bacterium]
MVEHERSGTRTNGRRTPPHAVPAFSFSEVVGTSAALSEARDAARIIARGSLSTVLIVGETGTGKELFARGIHAEGATGSSPFVAVNCAAIPESLLESELFGHEAGAFTGAMTRKQGLMEFAGCGTLFLDELHHLPPMLQPKLLRALEERRMRRLGGSEEIEMACRIVAATNEDIERAVEAGTFREDLFYRLNVMRVDVPPLRVRPDDIEVLALHFLAGIARGLRTPAKRLSPEAIAVLQAHRWPGNVRELRNVMERAAVLSGDSAVVELSHLLIQHRTNRSALGTTTSEGRAGDIAIPPEGKTLAAIEREAAVLTLQLAKGNRTHAARMLGISRPTLARILREAVVPALELEG